MRKIESKPILLFLTLFVPTCIFAVLLTVFLLRFLPLGEYKPVTTVAISILMIYLLNMVALRLFLWKRPLNQGEYAEGSKEEFTYNVYVLFYLLLFNSLTPSLLVPVPIMRLIYIGLGARLGKNTYSAGAILDPSLIEVGDNTIIGYDAVLCPHAVEGARVFFAKIKVGNNVTIGMRSMIMAGVTIEDGAIIAAGSFVKKGSFIKAGEVWGGTPAKLIRKSNQELEKINTIVSIGSSLYLKGIK
jgi:acetyltransferase-like isoleucine patch superfamily enzyme